MAITESTTADRTLATSQALLRQVALLAQQVRLITQVEEPQQILETRQVLTTWDSRYRRLAAVGWETLPGAYQDLRV